MQSSALLSSSGGDTLGALIGEVMNVNCRKGDPLLYYNSAYCELKEANERFTAKITCGQLACLFIN